MIFPIFFCILFRFKLNVIMKIDDAVQMNINMLHDKDKEN